MMFCPLVGMWVREILEVLKLLPTFKNLTGSRFRGDWPKISPVNEQRNIFGWHHMVYNMYVIFQKHTCDPPRKCNIEETGFALTTEKEVYSNGELLVLELIVQSP